MTMSYYRNNTHILRLPSQAKLPDLSVLQTNTVNVVYTESKTPDISLHKLDALVNRLHNQDLHLTKADKNGMTMGYLTKPLQITWMTLMIF